MNEYLSEDDIVIQVGDFGFYDSRLLYWPENGFKFQTYAIDGNHEDFRLLRGIRTPTEIRSRLTYVPRGVVLELVGKRVGFLGGGASIDKAYRKEGISWFADEVITDVDVETLIRNVGDTPLDYLVTHTPSTRFISTWFPPLDFSDWGIPPDWVDVSALRVGNVLETVKFGVHFCGHMHRSIWDGRTRCLDIAEVFYER
jgi:hypothetical protein